MSKTMSKLSQYWDNPVVEEPTRPKLTFPDKPIYPQKTVVFDQEKCTAVQEKEVEPLQSERPPLTAFEQDLRLLINKRSMENLSGTPDFILAEYMVHCLNAFTLATRARERWYGRKVF